MTPSQSKRLANLLKVIQETRRSLDKEAATGMTGIGQQFGTQFDLEDAVWGVVYAEKALARIWERENFVRELPDSTRDKLRLKPTTFLKR
jgi:hypothetical protein